MDLTPEQMRELDAWIAVHVMDEEWSVGPTERLEASVITNHFTTSHSAAMSLLEKCAEKAFPTCYKSRVTDEWCVDNQSEKGKATIIASASTLPLAIALFARRLFSTQTNSKEDE